MSIRNVSDRERQLCAEIDALKTYVAELEPDALRYRWFVKEMSTDSDALDACLVGLESNVDEGLNPTIEQFNSAIDSAMKEGTA